MTQDPYCHYWLTMLIVFASGWLSCAITSHAVEKLRQRRAVRQWEMERASADERRDWEALEALDEIQDELSGVEVARRV